MSSHYFGTGQRPSLQSRVRRDILDGRVLTSTAGFGLERVPAKLSLGWRILFREGRSTDFGFVLVVQRIERGFPKP